MSVVTASLFPDKPRRRNDEELLARSVAQFLRFALPADATFTHIPLGGLRHTRAAARLVGVGTKAGWPDYLLVWRGQAILIELKTPTGQLSESQRQMHAKLRYCGAPVFVCRSLDEVVDALEAAGVPLRHSMARP